MELAALLDTLDNQLHELEELVLTSAIVQAHTFALPVYGKEQHTIPDVIPVEASSGEPARQLGWRRIKNYSGDPNSNLKITRKAAGFIWLDCEAAKLALLCEQVNHTKGEIKTFLAKQKNRHVRFNLVHDLRPCAITLQILRKIHYCTDPLTSIRFSWATKTSNVRSKTDKAINLVEQERQQTMDEVAQANVNVLANQIASDRSKEVAFRRRLAPTPVIHLRYLNKPEHLSSKTQQLTNGIPILIAGKPDALKQIGSLNHFNNHAQKKPSYKDESVIIKP
ncbi:DNA replication terminus site-binding protein [Motilimonas sp. 1_MG-2023]|uniref:DNA replication terminus site-binding protein n=1 Tax=Motilimonas sp. 1_MG-2023 TaxID=3062672 RepID=UPI0026E2098B|nr:DNA replication terminus site-binding protein [Motilimonas sp. 1_MG-2023]MDO6527723.1 DNA replication terminus site-binding protein [Motilimonas sp. 1_MG-2023]